MATIDIDCAQGTSGESCCEITGGTYYNAPTNYLGKISTNKYSIGWRFNNVTIPQGATIDVAYITVYSVNSPFGTATTSTLYGDDVDDSAAWTSGTKPSVRTKTTASTAWACAVATGGTENTPSIVDIVQEIVDRGGWSSGNDMSIFAIDTSASSTLRDLNKAASGDYTSLHVEYTASGGGGANSNFLAFM